LSPGSFCTTGGWGKRAAVFARVCEGLAAERGCRCCFCAVLFRAVVQLLVQIGERKREERAKKEAIALVTAMQEATLKVATAEAMEATYVSLVQRVSSLGLCVENVKGDGNCLFRALARLTGYAGGHRALRRAVAAWLEGPGAIYYVNPQDPTTFLQNYLAEVSTPLVSFSSSNHSLCCGETIHTGPLVHSRQGNEDWGAYCRRMARDREWGGPIELIAAAHVLRRPILTFSSLADLDEQVSSPSGDGPFADPLAIGHVGGVHYVALLPEVRSIVEKRRFHLGFLVSVSPRRSPEKLRH
jgi:hypothetical protein